jgi:hypothetical protein
VTYQPSNGQQDTELHLQSVTVVPNIESSAYCTMTGSAHSEFCTLRGVADLFCLMVAKPGTDTFFIIRHLEDLQGSNVDLRCEAGTRFHLQVPERFMHAMDRDEPLEVHLLGSERPTRSGLCGSPRNVPILTVSASSASARLFFVPGQIGWALDPHVCVQAYWWTNKSLRGDSASSHSLSGTERSGARARGELSLGGLSRCLQCGTNALGKDLRRYRSLPVLYMLLHNW